MVNIRQFLLLMSLVVGRELAGGSVSPLNIHWPVAAGIVLASVGIFLIWGRALSRTALRNSKPTEAFNRLRPKLELTWLASHWLLLLSLGWFSIVEACSAYSELLSYLILVGPTLTWLAGLEWEASRCDTLQNQTSQSQSLMLRLRLGDLTGLVVCLAPMLICAAVYDFANSAQRFAEQGLRMLAVEVSLPWVPYAVGFCGLLLAIGTLPLWMGRWVGVRELRQSSLGRRIQTYQSHLGLEGLRVVLVPSNGRWRGAAVVGWLPRFRRMWLGDGLVQELSRQELDMVLLHEMAHVTRRHFLWRALPLVWAVGVNLCYVSVAPTLGPDATPLWAGKLVALLIAAAILIFGLGHVSRSCELDADREACRLAEKLCPWAGRPGIAEATLATALSKLMGGHAQRQQAKRTWMHPSLRERLSSLACQLATRRGGLASKRA